MAKPMALFSDALADPPGPKVVAAGKVQFRQQKTTGVAFPSPVVGPYIVVVCGDGNSGGALTPASTVFCVKSCNPDGFVIVADDNNCRQEVSWLAVTI
jgi:hypothetical protein